jgi:hypothetical protein
MYAERAHSHKVEAEGASHAVCNLARQRSGSSYLGGVPPWRRCCRLSLTATATAALNARPKEKQ